MSRDGRPSGGSVPERRQRPCRRLLEVKCTGLTIDLLVEEPDDFDKSGSALSLPGVGF